MANSPQMETAPPEVCTPSRSATAEVRTADTPTSPPHALVAWVESIETEVGSDWVLTEDAVAFGPLSVADDFDSWRATWMQTWELNTVDTVTTLLDRHPLLLHGATSTTTSTPTSTTTSTTFVIDAASTRDVHERLDDVRDGVAAANRIGFGVVDASPTATARGLRLAWPEPQEQVLLASTEELEVRLDPDRELLVAVTDERSERWVLDHIGQIDLCGDRILVSSGTAEVALDPRRGAPLAWLVPGAITWRVRRVPEVVVFAPTIHRLKSACEYAREHGADIALHLDDNVASAQTRARARLGGAV